METQKDRKIKKRLKLSKINKADIKIANFPCVFLVHQWSTKDSFCFCFCFFFPFFQGICIHLEWSNLYNNEICGYVHSQNHNKLQNLTSSKIISDVCFDTAAVCYDLGWKMLLFYAFWITWSMREREHAVASHSISFQYEKPFNRLWFFFFFFLWNLRHFYLCHV